MRQPVRIAVTGAAGHIGYSLLFRIATGEMLGQNQPVILQLLEVPAALTTLNGVVMELEDCAFPLLHAVEVYDDAPKAFTDIDYALLVGARPRSKGMERGDLLQANAEIFSEQGRALNERAKREVKVLVVGNPANTNALITQQNAPDLNPRQIHAMMRLDHNRATAQIARQARVPVTDVQRVTIWGNHSAKQYPDAFHVTVNDVALPTLVTEDWIKNTFIPCVQQRGAKVIEARGSSSAASAANAAINHMRDWVLGTPPNNWVSMGVPSDGSYNIAPGVIFGLPCTCKNGEYTVVPNLALNAFAQECLNISHQELLEEKSIVQHLFANATAAKK